MTSEFEFEGARVARGDVFEVESNLGVSLPSDFTAFLLSHNGGRPVPHNTFRVPNRRANEEDSIGGFYYVVPREHPQSIESAAARLKGRLPTGCVPIAYCACGDTLLLDCRSTDYGAVLLWDRDAEGTGAPQLFRVAGSIQELLGNLYE